MSLLKAVVWDMDGVILDSGEYHYQSWVYAFSRRGKNFTHDDFKRNFGRRNDSIIRYALGQDLSPEAVEQVAKEKEESYRSRLPRNMEPLPGVATLLKFLKEQGVKNAIASSAPLENIELALNRVGVKKYFNAVVYGREVTEGKPSPQIYLLAASKLGMEAEDCVVMEDAVAGVEGAKRAGMKCVAVTSTHDREALGQADLVVDTLESVSVADLQKLFLNQN